MHRISLILAPFGAARLALGTRPGGAGGEALDLLVLALLASAILIVAARTPGHAIALFAAQSSALAGIALVVAILSGQREIYLSVLVTIAVKVVMVPLLLLQVASRAGTKDNAAMYLGARPATILAIGLVLLAYGLVRSTAVAGTLITGYYFPTSVALILVGGLIMVVRKKALVQVIGLMVLENGVYIAGMATTNGLPPVVELGVAFDLFVTVVLLGSIAFHIGAATETLDTSTLRRLRG
jgi:hydrogenase-4 component E